VDEEQDDFLTHYSFPTHAVSGERLNWLRLPVLDRAWREDREDVGGFVQEASGWKPSPLQLAWTSYRWRGAQGCGLRSWR
jgi:hypothetical protein